VGFPHRLKHQIISLTYYNISSNQVKRPVLPYHPSLKALAKKLRSNMTFSEIKLWNELKGGKMLGYDFDRQRPIANYIVDFYCKDLALVIEVDGITHEEPEQRKRDALRQRVLEDLGLQVLRFDALLVVNKVDAAMREIYNWIIAYENTHGVAEHIQKKRGAHH
jgi:very-short-patch-repair endonuclease